jgi:CRISPR/Cas system-associated exonuclease Cas4 (RecB family)
LTIIIRKDSYFLDLLKRNLKEYYDTRRRLDNIIHISDVLPSNCLRKQYYTRKIPEKNILSDELIQHFIRGESSEFVISKLSNIGVTQNELKIEELVAHPDIMNEEMIVELKDTTSHKRLDINDKKFRSYLRQLLYYLVISGLEKGIISIRYTNDELKFIKSDLEGDYFFRPNKAKKQQIESWRVFLPKDDIIREILKNEMIRRKNLLLKAIVEDDVSILPRIPESKRGNICTKCEYFHKCMNIDDETKEAIDMSKELDVFDIKGIIDFKPVFEDGS